MGCGCVVWHAVRTGREGLSLRYFGRANSGLRAWRSVFVLTFCVICLSARGGQTLQTKVPKLTKTALTTGSPCSVTCGKSPPALLQMSSISLLAVVSRRFHLMTSWHVNLLGLSHSQPNDVCHSEGCREMKANKCHLRDQMQVSQLRLGYTDLPLLGKYVFGLSGFSYRFTARVVESLV